MPRGICLALWGLLWPAAAAAAVVVPAPGHEITVLEERVLLVYDPLTASQTLVTQHIFEGTSTAFGLIIPTPGKAHVRVGSDRLQRAIQGRLHPRSRARRSLDIQVVSWLSSCVVRRVGDAPVDAGDTSAATGQATVIGQAPEPLHDWLLGNGFTISPAQATWLAKLRGRGWGLVGVVVRPPDAEGPPLPRMRGPVLIISHEASEPAYAAGEPPFALSGGTDASPHPVEIAILTEWAVDLDAAGAADPFYADTIRARDVGRLGGEGGGRGRSGGTAP